MKSIDKRLDALWSEKIRSVGKCEYCNKNSGLQAHHIIPRSHRNTRWDLKNGVCLCTRHHLYWAHKDAIEFAEWVKARMGEDEYRALRMRGQIVGRGLDKEAIRIYLENEEPQIWEL